MGNAAITTPTTNKHRIASRISLISILMQSRGMCSTLRQSDGATRRGLGIETRAKSSESELLGNQLAGTQRYWVSGNFFSSSSAIASQAS